MSAACAAGDEISDIKAFTEGLGFERTGNFHRESPGLQAHYRCYYTGKLKLPDSYDGLRERRGSAAGCRIDEEEYDVFFYAIEAVASGKAKVSSSLKEATDERRIVVVAHEDFHEMVHHLPVHVAEAATTLVGFLAAAEYAKARYGETSVVYGNLSREAELFARKAAVITSYYERLSDIYRSKSKQAALEAKGQIFEELRRECEAIPAPRSFNRCPAVFNNAGLAFDMTYAKEYGRLYELYLANGRDLRALIQELKARRR